MFFRLLRNVSPSSVSGPSIGVTLLGAGSGSTASVDISGVATGDLMVVCVAERSGSGGFTPPSGWTVAGSLGTSSNLSAEVYYRKKAATDGTTASWGLSSSAFWAINGYSLTGIDGSSPLTVAGSWTSTTSGTTATAAGVSGVGARGLILAFFAHSAGAATLNWSETGWTALSQNQATTGTVGVRCSAFAAYETLLAGGSTSSETASVTNAASGGNLGIQVAFKWDGST